MNRFLKKHGSKLLFVALNAIFVFFISELTQAPVFRPVQTNNQIAQSSPSPQVAGKSIEGEETFLVTRVIDGDTIELEGGQKVRYIGVDTPEITKKDCFALESTQKNKDLVLNRRVELVKDVSETDRYGRLLRYVYVNDIFVNNVMVREGFANVSTYPPDVKFSQQFKRAEEEAREQRKGLWGGCKN